MRISDWSSDVCSSDLIRLQYGRDPALIVENKGASVALHYRAAPERADECQNFVRTVAATHGLDVLIGKMVVEARPRGLHKGRAVETLMTRPLFRDRVPVFVGDDTTDEDGFAFVQLHGRSEETTYELQSLMGTSVA